MFQKIVDRPGFDLFELILAVLCGSTWFLFPQVGWYPLILAAAPWFIRLAAGRPPIPRTRFDLALLVFLLSAAIALWAAYDRGSAWEKFWVIVGSILVFYALARQPRGNLWAAAAIFSLSGTLVALSFLMGHDWLADPTGIGRIDQIGAQWMTWRPSLVIPSLHPNITGGLLGMALPFAIGLTVRTFAGRGDGHGAWKYPVVASMLIGIASSLIISIGLLMTSSRGALIAVLVSFLIWGLWIICGYLTRVKPVTPGRMQPRVGMFLLALAFAGVAVLVVVTLSGGGLLELADRLPGLPSGESRIALARDTYQLINDFWYTGAGLRSFGGLYSQYIMGTPFFLYGYSHNFYLDVAFEQGLFGFLALIYVMAVSIWLLARLAISQNYNAPLQALTGAAFTSLLIVLLHGFVDDALYSGMGTPFLFSLAGMAIAISRSAVKQEEGEIETAGWIEESRTNPTWVNLEMAGKITLAIALIGMLISWRRPLAAELYADLGALEMARVELTGFPTGKWDDGRNITALVPSMHYLATALQLDPSNPTALHRMGLIAESRGDFQTAITNLEQAYLGAPTHRGIRKALGYSYVWSGDYHRASMLLKDLPETERELKNYVGWWANNNREDLSDQAKMMAAFMESSSE